MVNRQTRNPGTIRRLEATGRVSADVPGWAVEGGYAFQALAQVAGGLAGTLGKLATEARVREVLDEAAGVIRSWDTGASYLRMQAAQNAAQDKAGADVSAATRGMRGEVRKTISEAAERHGVDANALLRIAMLESSGNPAAKNPNSSAGGLFQFIDATARQYGLSDRFDPTQAADAAARLMKDNAAHLRRSLGREPNGPELYLAHQQGAGGAARLLANPDASAASIVGADAVRLNGGQEGMTAGEFAGLWLRKAGAAPAMRNAPPSEPIVPTLPTTPLALRRDGTIAGEAYDRALANAYGWRMQAGLSGAMQAAFEANDDDPAALQEALVKVHEQFAADPNLAYPQLQEMFSRQFVERSEAYLRGARAKAETKMRAEEQAAASEGIAAQRLEVERQAVALGANPEGDRIVAREVERAGRAIDGAVASGALTPAQAREAKEKLAVSAALGRAQGVYQALETPEEKEAFAAGLLEEWTAGKGPLAKLPFARVKALSTTLWNDARAEANRLSATQKTEAARLDALTRDDVASMQATGQGIAELSPDAVAALLGPEKLARWQADREVASRSWAASAGMETQTADEIAERLLLLAPEPGSEGYREQAAIHAAAQKKVSALLKARTDDPAAAVEASFRDVAALAAQAQPQDPDAMQALVSARLQAQAAIGIDELGQAPLTTAEALSLARAVTQQPDLTLQAQAMAELVEQVQAVYGPHADSVLTQVLQVRGVDRELAAYGAQMFRRMPGSRLPTAADRRQGEVLSETAAAEADAAPRPSDAWPMPSYRALQMLIEHPETAGQFDEIYGPDAAARQLGPLGPMDFSGEDQGTTTLHRDGSEDWVPDPGTQRQAPRQPRRPVTPTPQRGRDASQSDPSSMDERFR